MRKRIRKKKHLGEFMKFGILISFDAPEDKTEEIIDDVNKFTDAHGLFSWGGGYGWFSMQQVRRTYNVPKVVVDIVRLLISGEIKKPMFCIYSPQEQRISDEIKEELASEFANSPYKVSISPKQINLWHY